MSVNESGNFISADQELELPFFPRDLFAEDRAELFELLGSVGASDQFILGPRVAELESETCRHTGARHAIACASGTGGLNLAVRALGIGPGDEVVVPAFCCQPVVSSVVNNGAKAVFADIDPRLLVMPVAAAEAAITPRTKAIMPAHVFSIMADMAGYRELGRKYGLPVLEDAAVAQGAVLDGIPSGRWGNIGVFSHFQVKALGTIGEGGTIVTDDDALADSCRLLRNHGQRPGQRFSYERLGFNCRMDELTAAFLLHRFPQFERRLARRAAIAAYYTERFAELEADGLAAPPPGQNGRCYYVYAVLSDRREELRRFLSTRGIGSHVYYPLPLPVQPAFAYLAGGREYPHASAAGRRNLALPIYPHLTDAQVERIAGAVREFFRGAPA